VKKLLIITGPQGSGNHLFSRILSLHPDVGGWKDLLDEYWIPSDLEPFAEYWVHPDALTLEAFEGADYWLANVSVPFVYDGVKQVPKIDAMASKARSLGIDVQICVIVRDQYVNALQQQRVRKETTLPIAVDYFDSLDDVHYLDHEAFFLYKDRYLKWLSKILDFPIAYNDPNIMKFIEEGPNKKYVKYVEEHWLDEQVWKGIQPKKERGL
jgi:hypothetical protein